MIKKAMIWAREHREAWNTIHTHTELTFERLSLDELRRLDKYSVHHSAAKKRRQGSKYYIGILDGYYVYIRVANHWGCFYTNTGIVDPDGDNRHEIPYILKSYNWVLKDVSMTKKGYIAKISQAGFIRLAPVEQI